MSYRVTIEKINGMRMPLSAFTSQQEVEDSEVIYEQTVEDLDIPEMIMSVLNNSEYGLDIDPECPIHGHLSNRDLYKEYEASKDAEDSGFPFGNEIKGFTGH